MNISQHCFVPFSYVEDSRYTGYYRCYFPYAPYTVRVFPFPYPTRTPSVFGYPSATAGDAEKITFSTLPLSYIPSFSRPNGDESFYKFLLYF